ncbi:MAG: lipopolysaccharide biosynthesis protein [Nitrospira sp.]|nr:MAG: lipopolysaccharide biosynthesis protein [Nitrospira sp.]
MAFEETTFRAKVFRGFLWLSIGTFIVQFISWISTICVIRLLSPADYGLMAMTAGFVTLLMSISELGIGAALIQAKELTEREIRQIFTWVLITGLIGVIVSYASAPWVAEFYDTPELVTMIRVLSCSMFLAMAYVVPQALFIREMNFKIKAQIEVFANLAATLLTLVLALNGLGVWSLIVGQMALFGIKALAFNVTRPRWIAPLFDLRGSGKLLWFGLNETGSRLLYYVSTQSDNVIVGKFLGGVVLGGYAVAQSLAVIPMEKVLPIISQISFASYARIQDNKEQIRTNILKTVRAIAFAGVPVFLGMAAVAPLGLPLILGSKWESFVVPFQLLCLTLPLRALSPILPPAVLAINRPTVNLVNMVIASVAMASAFLVGVQYGVIGVCISWLVAYPVVFGITTIRNLRVLGISVRDYLGEIRFPFFAGAIMLASLWLFGKMFVTPWPLCSLTLQTLLGAVVYLALIMIFDKEQSAEIREHLSRFTAYLTHSNPSIEPSHSSSIRRV